jgi:hypothetical protein
MSAIEKLRQKYPQYQDKTDAQLLFGVYKKFYSDKPLVGFVKQLDLEKNQVTDFLVEAGKQGQTVGFNNANKPSVGGDVTGTARGLFQGATFGFGDEIIAGGTAGLKKIVSGDDRSLGDIYQQELQRERERIGEFRETDPIKAYGSEFAGGAAVPLGVAKNVKQAVTLGSGTGGAYAAGSSEGDAMDRLMAVPTGAAFGAILGGTFQVAGRTVQDLLKDFLSKKAQKAAAEGAKSVEQLKNEASVFYDDAMKNGLKIDPASLQVIIDDALTAARRSGDNFNRGLTPKSAGVIDDIRGAIKDFSKDINKSFGIQDLEELRMTSKTPMADFGNKSEQRAGGFILDAIDKYMAELSPDQLVSGSADNVVDTIQKARGLWAKMSKAGVIEEILNTAPNYRGGLESGLKNQVKSILNSKKKRSQFSKEEQKLLAEIQQGTPLGNLIGNLSKMGLSSSGGNNPISAMGGAGVGVGSLLAGVDPIIATSIGLASTAGLAGLRHVREQSLKQRVELFQAIVANGLADQVKTANPSAFRALEAAANSLTSGATKGAIAATDEQVQFARDKAY